MPKPVGGRGKKAPYESVMVRTPLPIKPEVEALISAFRNRLTDEEKFNSVSSESDIQQAIKLVYKFAEERNLTEKLTEGSRYRDCVQLIRFLEWLQSQTATEPDTL